MSDLQPQRPTSRTQPKRSTRNLALLLIAAGVTILLWRSGIFSTGFWSVVWPLGLIAFGLDLVTEGQQRRRIVTGALIALVVLVPLVGGARLVGPQPPQPPDLVSQPEVVSGDVDHVRGDINLAAGRLSIESLSDSRNEQPGASIPLAELDPSGDLPQYYSTDGRTGVLTIHRGPLSDEPLDLRLARDVPLDLTITLLAGDAAPLNFADLELANLNLNVVAGDAEVQLPNQGVMNLNISNTVGDIEIDVPEELPARIEIVHSIGGDVHVDEDRFQQRDGAYVSDGYSDSAPNRATIKINAGTGSVRIK